jgi:hypothetical protein
MPFSSNRTYGIKVRRSNGNWETHWYGVDRDKRDRQHVKYSKKGNVLAVQDVQMKN